MTSNTNTRSARTKGTIALATGAVLLLGGSTFALWSSESEVAGGNITTGNLDVLVSAGSWQDASPEHETPIDIEDLGDFIMVPGDVVQGTFAVDVAGLGDNLLAELAIGFSGAEGDLLADSEGVTIGYSITDAEGNAVGNGSAVSIVSANSNLTVPSAVVVDNDATGTTPEFLATVSATFDPSTSDEVRAATKVVLGDLSASLVQKRP